MHDRPVVIITGAADGIGFATAQRFANSGHSVAILDTQEALAEKRARSLGDDHLALRCNVAAETDVKAAVAAVVKKYGRLDTVINNAGIGSPHIPTVEQAVDSFEKVLHVHLTGAFLMAKEAARIMIPFARGSIVNISSIAGVTGLPRRNAYGAAKAGIVALTRSLACEWAKHGIRVNAVAPGYTATELVTRLTHESSFNIAMTKSRIPMGRLAEPAEIAEAIHFLASPAASYITGSTLSVDGGWAAFGDAGPAC